MLTRHRFTPLVGALGFVVGVVVPPAHANDPAHCTITAAGRVCDVVAAPPGAPGSTVPAGGSGENKVTCQYLGDPIDCASEGGTWSNAEQCWVQLRSPQPAASDPIWAGHTGGAIFWCQPPAMAGAIGGGHAIWAAAPPPQVNPAQLARQAVDRMGLHRPLVGATPLPSAEAVSLIGLPTWLWIADPDEHSWGPITRTASADAVTVTATAKVAKVVWDMGDDHTVTCAGKGTVWTAEKGTGDSPTCGYRYTRPGRRTITATTFWAVDWSGAGQTGKITFDMSGTRTVNVVELRAVVTG